MMNSFTCIYILLLFVLYALARLPECNALDLNVCNTEQYLSGSSLKLRDRLWLDDP